MSSWSGWDWISYACLGFAALGLAVGAWGKENPEMSKYLPLSLFSSPKWAAVPAVLVALATIIFIVRLLVPADVPTQPKTGEVRPQQPLVINEPTPLKKMFTAYDIEQRLRAIDEIYAFLGANVTDASAAGEKLNATLAARIDRGTAIADLDRYADDTKTTLEQYFRNIAKFQYFPDIYLIAFSSDWNPMDIPKTSSLLRAELQEIEQRGQSANAMQYLRNNRYMAEFQGLTSGKFWRWINQKQEQLTKKRREYEQAPVYPK